MRVNNVLLNHAKRSGFLTKVEVVSRQATAQTDYQIQVEDILSRKGNGEDILFAQKNQILNHWKESYASWQSDVWAKLPKLPVIKSQILNILSGNPSASSASNGTNTFVSFDNFEDGTIDKWSGNTGDFAVSTNYAYKGSYSLVKTGANGFANGYLYIANSVGDAEITLFWRSATAGIVGNGGPTLCHQTGDVDHFYNLYGERTTYTPWLEEFNNGGLIAHLVAGDSTLGDHSAGDWLKMVLIRTGNNLYGRIYDPDDVLISSMDYSSTLIANGYPGIFMYDPYYIDEVRVRKYASPEPLIVKRKISGKAGIIRAVCGGIAS